VPALCGERLHLAQVPSLSTPEVSGVSDCCCVRWLCVFGLVLFLFLLLLFLPLLLPLLLLWSPPCLAHDLVDGQHESASFCHTSRGSRRSCYVLGSYGRRCGALALGRCILHLIIITVTTVKPSFACCDDDAQWEGRGSVIGSGCGGVATE
jgi:hypothetical protein